MSQDTKRFIKFIPGPESDFLLTKPIAFTLLALVAERARREPGHPDGLEPGEAFIGDWDAIGASRQNYRTALDMLVTRKHFKICETNRTRKKSTTGITTKGTKVKIISSTVWDINLKDINHQSNHCPTTDQPLTNHEQERIRTNQERNKKGTIVRNEEKEEKIVRPIFRSSPSFEEDLGSLKEVAIALRLDIDEKDFSTWLKKYGKENIDLNLGIMCRQKIKVNDHAAWMNAALHRAYAEQAKNISINREFAKEFKIQNRWSSLTITKKYCRNEETQHEYYFYHSIDNFKEFLESEYIRQENAGRNM